VATRMFANEELERLRGFPEISREELFRSFTLTPADLAFVAPGRGRGPAERLGWAIALCTLPWLVGSCRIGWSRPHRWRWLALPSSCRWIWWQSVPMADKSRPAPSMCAWPRGTWDGVRPVSPPGDRFVAADVVHPGPWNHRVFGGTGGEIEDPVEQGRQFLRQLPGVAGLGDDVLEIAGVAECSTSCTGSMRSMRSSRFDEASNKVISQPNTLR